MNTFPEDETREFVVVVAVAAARTPVVPLSGARGGIPFGKLRLACVYRLRPRSCLGLSLLLLPCCAGGAAGVLGAIELTILRL